MGPAVLCLHGLTGTPYEVRQPAEALAERGFACLGPELPGHGTSPEVLAATSRSAWLEAVLGAFDRLAATHARVYAVGLSLGGLLTLALCQRRPVQGSVVLAAPLELSRAVRWAVPLLAPAIRSIPKTSDIVDDAARARHPGYRRMPLAAVRELMRLQREVERGLDRIESPLRLIYSRADRTVRLEDAERILRQVSSPDPEVITLDRSGHVLPVDLERERVTKEVVDFLYSFVRGRTLMAELPGAAVKRLLTSHGGGLRSSGSAVELAVAAAEGYIARLAQEASASAQRDKRKTIMDTDIQRAKEALGG
ncbi:MAG: alpha/beta fold hydrolase [Deltaproteobacteria bacterium]|nr:alpha/beta fold hydrolase [Deltaproteobacteria bacterium]